MTYEILFNNWKKYQPNGAVHPRWLAFQNDFAFNHNFRNFTFGERLTFIYLLCEASRQNDQGRINIEADTFQRLINVRASVIISTINKLLERKIISYTTRQDKTISQLPIKEEIEECLKNESFEEEMSRRMKKLNEGGHNGSINATNMVRGLFKNGK